MSCLACVLSTLVFSTSVVSAATKTSLGDGDWETAGTWSPSGEPGVSDDVYIQSGHTVTINGVAVDSINSLSVSGVLDHAANSTTEANKIILDIANDCTVAGGGVIDVQGLGYNGSEGPGQPVSGTWVGGSHGGIGGLAYGGAEEAGDPYGSVIAPTNLGSGGGSSGAYGGGAVRLDVGGACTIDGAIDADGVGASSAAGAGGSVYITAGTFGGTGTITAEGANSGHGDTGGGGGGRIAVTLTSGSAFGSVTMSADGFPNGNSGYPSTGTIFTKIPSQTYGTLKLDNGGVPFGDGGGRHPGTPILDGETWTFDTLALTNGGSLVVNASTTLSPISDFSGSSKSGYLVVEAGGTLLVPSGNLTITNVTFVPDPASILLGMTNLTVASGGCVTHKDNVNAETYRIYLAIPGDLTVAAGGKIDVKGLGYESNQGPGKPVSGIWAGGSHGGSGGDYHDGSVAGDPYGSVIAPTNLGSGGGSGDTTAEGGGAVRLDVGGACTIDGAIDADGIGTGSGSSTAGAGGSVYITAGTFGGGGTISANGGVHGHADTGGGGGGRIAVVLTNGSTFGSVTMTAAPYKKGDWGNASAGTIFTKTAAQSHGTLKVDGDALAPYFGTTDFRNKATALPIGVTIQVDSVCVTNYGNLWVPTNTTLIVSDFAPSHTSGYLTVEGVLDPPDDFAVSNLTFMPHRGCVLDVTNLTISSSARVTHFNNRATEDFTLEIDIPGNLTIESGASIDVTAMGYRYNKHPDGTYPGSGVWGLAGSHGGRGGRSSPNYGSDPAYATYGSIAAPTNIGSGGYGHTSPRETDGGGAIKLSVGGTTTVSGSILANGLDDSLLLNGGGAGGSIWLTTASLAGSGMIRANGGTATAISGPDKASGGGGGRVAVILTGSDSFASVSMEAFGGAGTADHGAAGTVYKQTQTQGAAAGALLIDNNGQTTAVETFLPSENDPLTNEIASAFLIVTNADTKATASSHVALGNVLLYADVDVTLGSYAMYVSAAEHNLEDLADPTPGVTNQVDDYSHIVWLGVAHPPGTVIVVH